MRKFRALLVPTLASTVALLPACSTEDSGSYGSAKGESAVAASQVSVTPVAPFMTGDLGTIAAPAIGSGAQAATLRGRDAAQHADSALSFLHGFALDHLSAVGDEELEAVSYRQDGRGNVIIRANQRINGLPVVGAQLVIQADAETGVVTRVNGHFVPNEGLRMDPALAAEEALAFATEEIHINVDRKAGTPELAYVLGQNGQVVLAWSRTVEYVDEQGPQRDIVFADAVTGELVARHPQHHYAKSLRTYNCNQGTSCSNLVSSSSGTINTGDNAIDSAHNYAIATYDYYNTTFGRDSIDNAGMTLRSRVHYSSNYNNAFWDGYQMTYGDGDGTTFVPLSQDADVVAHELTHGVTENESGLIYSYESGALNEALSDIFGALVDRATGATGDDIWLIGEDIYTPGTPGDGLRNMADPESEGDYDYYPTRYTGSQDNGGVHWNSGIANLAFKLLVTGGTHPRGKTTTNVTAIGFDAAADIFYNANVNCMTPSSNFEAARNCTAQFAGANVDAVHEAWDAVGVPGGGGGGGGGGGTLEKDVPESNLSGSTGEFIHYTMDVPAGATDLSFTISGGSGDADLYVKFGSQPTTSSYDCRPYKNGNNETCTFATPSAGTYHVSVRAYSSFSGVSLVGTYTEGGGGGCTPSTDTLSNLSGSTGAEDRYTQSVPSCATSLTITISGGSGDADLYVKFGSAPTTSSYDCRPYKYGNEETCTFTPPQAGDYEIMIRGYSAYSGVTLTSSYE